MSRPLLTLGYGNRQLDDVLALLRTHEVRYLIDVRSAPYSRFNPAFSRGNLKAVLEDVGIRRRWGCRSSTSTRTDHRRVMGL